MQHVVEEETALIQFLHDISTHHLTDINIASSKHKVYWSYSSEDVILWDQIEPKTRKSYPKWYDGKRSFSLPYLIHLSLHDQPPMDNHGPPNNPLTFAPNLKKKSCFILRRYPC